MSRRLLVFLMILSLYFGVADLRRVLARGNFQPLPVDTNAYAQADKAVAQGDYFQAVGIYKNALARDPKDCRTRFRLGETLVSLKRYQEAFAQYHEILQLQPGNIAARFELAKCQIKLGDPANAVTQLEWITRSDPKHTEAKALLDSCRNHAAANPDTFVPLPKKAPAAQTAAPDPEGKVYVWGGKQETPKQAPAQVVPPLARAQTTWKVSEFLKATPHSLGVRLEYAKYCLEKGDLSSAEQSLKDAESLALKAEKSDRLLEIHILKALLTLYQADIRGFGKILMQIKPLLSKETHDSFLDIYNKAAAMTSPVDIARLVGGVAMGAEHVVVAAKILKEVTGLNPRDSLALRILGHAQLEGRNLDEAEKTFLSVVRNMPQDPEANFNLGRFYLTAKVNVPNAKFYLLKARELAPRDERTRFMIGTLYLLEGNDAEGSLILDNLSQESKEPSIREMAAHLMHLRAEAQGDWARLKQQVVADLAVPGSPYVSTETFIRCGKDALKRGSLFQAMRYFMEARALAEIGRVYLAMASNLAAAGESDAAAVAAGFGMSAIREELAHNPQSSVAHLYLALYHVERSDFPTARLHVQEALRRSPSAETRHLLEKLQHNLG